MREKHIWHPPAAAKLLPFTTTQTASGNSSAEMGHLLEALECAEMHLLEALKSAQMGHFLEILKSAAMGVLYTR
jgi:hypothetical protein